MKSIQFSAQNQHRNLHGLSSKIDNRPTLNDSNRGTYNPYCSTQTHFSPLNKVISTTITRILRPPWQAHRKMTDCTPTKHLSYVILRTPSTFSYKSNKLFPPSTQINPILLFRSTFPTQILRDKLSHPPKSPPPNTHSSCFSNPTHLVFFF